MNDYFHKNYGIFIVSKYRTKNLGNLFSLYDILFQTEKKHKKEMLGLPLYQNINQDYEDNHQINTCEEYDGVSFYFIQSLI